MKPPAPAPQLDQVHIRREAHRLRERRESALAGPPRDVAAALAEKVRVQYDEHLVFDASGPERMDHELERPRSRPARRPGTRTGTGTAGISDEVPVDAQGQPGPLDERRQPRASALGSTVQQPGKHRALPARGVSARAPGRLDGARAGRQEREDEQGDTLPQYM
jgi:hypothetical protein